jgi:hypothetical protein
MNSSGGGGTDSIVLRLFEALGLLFVSDVVVAGVFEFWDITDIKDVADETRLEDNDCCCGNSCLELSDSAAACDDLLKL